MHRSDYRNVATGLAISVAISGMDNAGEVLTMVAEFANQLAKTNDNFDRQKFLHLFWGVYAQHQGILAS